ncbi:MAG: insulinase family protein, partial [Coriobacteriia bacterium]|nr:insulinase family protein [Coriobacteriia bacterium]
VLGILKTEIDKMLADGVTQEELERVQEYTIGNIVLAHELTPTRMMRLGRNHINGLGILSLDEIICRYRAVTRDDILRVAERVLSLPPTVAVISPLEQAEVAGLL